MQRLKPVLFSTMILLIASSCGQKGPLYLSEAENPVQQAGAEEPQTNEDGNNEDRSKDDSGINEENP